MVPSGGHRAADQRTRPVVRTERAAASAYTTIVTASSQQATCQGWPPCTVMGWLASIRSAHARQRGSRSCRGAASSTLVRRCLLLIPALPVAESVRGTPHRDPPPRVPRPRRGAERNAPASPVAGLPHLLPPVPHSPLTGKGLPRAETGGAPRPGQNRRDAHGQRPASSVLTAGCVGSRLPAECTSDAEVSVQHVRLGLSLPVPSGSGIRTDQIGQRSVLFALKGPMRQMNVCSRSSEHLDGLSGRERYDPSRDRPVNLGTIRGTRSTISTGRLLVKWRE